MKTKNIFLIIIALLFTSLWIITACDNRVLEEEDYDIVYMRANPDTIYADNNITYSEIDVMVKDEDGFAVTNEIVTFKTDIGNIIKEISTDSTGIAQTTFWDNGEVGIATIQAFIGNKSEHINVTIKETPEITLLQLLFNSPELNIDETTLVKAECENEIGKVPDGTLVAFNTDIGYFQDQQGVDLSSATQISTTNGTAKVYLNAGTQKGEATITATIGEVSDEKTITIHPGSPRYMYLDPEVEEIQANSNQDVQIIAQVEDRYHNAVESGVGVTFSTDLGSVIEFDNTDSLGFAETIFSPGIQAGSAVIEATADSAQASTVISVVSDEVYSIQFAFSGQIDIQVQGTGGQESKELQVNLYDVNGNLIDEPTEVWFKFINGPNGININNQVFWPGNDSLSVMSSGGHAIISISSGSYSGPASLKTYTYRDSSEVFAKKSDIVVHSGPPNSVDIATSGIDSGEDMGGGIWQIECAAILSDSLGNPVDHGTAVWFSLPNDPDWASIGAAAYVGNENANGDSLEGAAYTTLEFAGGHTNDTLIVKVVVSGDEYFIAEQTIIMPAQFLALDIDAIPIHLDWIIPNDDDPKYTQIWVTVVDGQNNPVDNQDVFFSCQRGIPVSCNYNGFTQQWEFGDDMEAIVSTGADGEPGLLIHGYKFEKIECNPPGMEPPGQITLTVEAHLLGHQTSNSVDITLYRYVD